MRDANDEGYGYRKGRGKETAVLRIGKQTRKYRHVPRLVSSARRCDGSFFSYELGLRGIARLVRPPNPVY